MFYLGIIYLGNIGIDQERLVSDQRSSHRKVNKIQKLDSVA